jgi:hypothetical protein
MVAFAGMIGAQNGETVWHRTKVVRQIGLAAVPNIGCVSSSRAPFGCRRRLGMGL